jgi:hypothetical protein
VVTSNIKERRSESLSSADTNHNRISFGCINVPQEFFNDVVSASFKSTNGIVYVLPETRTNHAVFASYYDVE